MSSAPLLQYGPPPPASPPRSKAGRIVLTVLATLLSIPATGIALVAAAITYSGCFISCHPESGDHVGGTALGALAAVLLTVGPLTAAAAFRSRAWLVASAGVFGVALLLVLTALSQS